MDSPFFNGLNSLQEKKQREKKVGTEVELETKGKKSTLFSQALYKSPETSVATFSLPL